MKFELLENYFNLLYSFKVIPDSSSKMNYFYFHEQLTAKLGINSY